MKTTYDTLIQKIGAADSSVIESVTEEYRKNILALSESMINNRNAAFEIACEAFSVSLGSAEKFCDSDSFEKQLYRICRSLCRKSHVTCDNLVGNPLLRILNSLPVKYRSILILSDVYSFTLQKTALMLGISEQKAQRRLHNGRLLIVKLIKNQISE